MHRRQFLLTSVASAVGLWGCGSSSDFSGNPGGGAAPVPLQSDAIFTSDDRTLEVEANINARGDIVYVVRAQNATKGLEGGRIARVRAGATESEVLVQGQIPAGTRITNPRIDTNGDSLSWLETQNGQTRIAAIFAGQRVNPWLPLQGYQFVQNLGIDSQGRQLYAIAEDGQGNCLLLRGDEAAGTTTAYEFPFSGLLRLRMERSCRYAVGHCRLGAIAFSNDGPTPSFQLLSSGTPQSYSVNATGGIGVLEEGGDYRYYTRQISTVAAFPAGTIPTGPSGQPIAVPPGVAVGNLFAATAQALSEAAHNATNAQQESNQAAQGATTSGVATLYSIDTASSVVGTQTIYSLVVVTPTASLAGNSLYTQLPGQIASEMDIQDIDGCVTLNNPPQILRIRPAGSQDISG